MKYKKIFIACPISKYLKEEGIDEEFEKFIKIIYDFCKKYSDDIFLALKREEYGKKKMYGADCTIADYKEMKNTDLLIAFPEDSMGVSVELGWASALGIETIVFIDKKYKQSELVKSINSIVSGTSYQINTQDGFLSQIDTIKKDIYQYVSTKIN